MRQRNEHKTDPEFIIWTNLKRKKNLIPIDSAWLGPEGYLAFKNDVGSKPSPEASLRRKDKSQGWTKLNIYWYNGDMSTLGPIDLNLKPEERIKRLRAYGLSTGILIEGEDGPQEEKAVEPSLPFDQDLDLVKLSE